MVIGNRDAGAHRFDHTLDTDMDEIGLDASTAMPGRIIETGVVLAHDTNVLVEHQSRVCVDCGGETASDPGGPRK